MPIVDTKDSRSKKLPVMQDELLISENSFFMLLREECTFPSWKQSPVWKFEQFDKRAAQKKRRVVTQKAIGARVKVVQ